MFEDGHDGPPSALIVDSCSLPCPTNLLVVSCCVSVVAVAVLLCHGRAVVVGDDSDGLWNVLSPT